jgi:hypothetical protein|tara:strand:- start:842 stop:1891 length:1050 start_codon:yes stop_codon:yes gene_type:complete
MLFGMATRNASNLCKSLTKAEHRACVLTAFHCWLGSLFKFTHTKDGHKCKVSGATVYSLPANIWEFEQFLAGESLLMTRLSADSQIDLHCFESEWATYAAQKDSRSFMLNMTSLYKNFNFKYSHDLIHSNHHAKSNFGAWYDFCGNPTPKLLDIAIAPQNFKHNSLVFITFDCNVQAGIQVLPPEIQNFIVQRLETKGGIIADHITDAVVDYINKNTGNKVKCIMDVEYQAQRHPMMLLGFTNSCQVLEQCKPISSRILREKKNKIIANNQNEEHYTIELSDLEKEGLKSDLKSFKFTRDELVEKYTCSPRQISAQKAWLSRCSQFGGYKNEDLVIDCLKKLAIDEFYI